MPDLEEADEIQHEAYDRYITARVCVPKGGEMSYGTVKNRKRRLDGDLMGRSNANPILDTSIYEVEFDDGSTEAYTANIIAEHIYPQVDGEGYTQYMLNEIVDHKCWPIRPLHSSPTRTSFMREIFGAHRQRDIHRSTSRVDNMLQQRAHSF